MRNLKSGEEVWHVFVSRLNMLLAALGGLLIIFIIVLTVVAYTPILDLIPGYPGNKARQALFDNILKLDSLERQVVSWNRYHSNLALILEGKDPSSLSADSLLSSRASKSMITPRSYADSLLRQRLSSDSGYMSVMAIRKVIENTFDMIPPVSGMVVSGFNPKAGRFGIEITPLPNQAIMAIMDGSVILNTWNPDKGYMVVVQHGGNMISIYTNLARVMRHTGDRVKAGEAIAMTKFESSGNHNITFELWYNGNAVDPENYIAF